MRAILRWLDAIDAWFGFGPRRMIEIRGEMPHWDAELIPLRVPAGSGPWMYEGSQLGGDSPVAVLKCLAEQSRSSPSRLMRGPEDLTITRIHWAKAPGYGRSRTVRLTLRQDEPLRLPADVDAGQ